MASSLDAFVENLLSQFENITDPITKEIKKRQYMKEVLSFIQQHEALNPIFKSVSIVFYIIIISIGVLLSFLFIVTITTRRILLRNPSNALLINLFISNLLICLFCIPPTIIWIRGSFYDDDPFNCKFTHFFQHTSVVLSSLTIAIISVDRLYRIKSERFILNFNNPNIRNLFGRKHRCQVLIEYLIIWSISIIVSLPILIYRYEWINELTGITECLDAEPFLSLSKSYSIMITLVHFVLPSLVVISCHIMIKNHLNQSLQRFRRRFQIIQNVAGEGDELNHINARVLNEMPGAEERFNDLHQREIERNREVTRFLTLIAISFIICWAPLEIFHHYNLFYPPVPQEYKKFKTITVICHLISMLSVPINCLFYGWDNSQVRVEARNLFYRTLRMDEALDV